MSIFYKILILVFLLLNAQQSTAQEVSPSATTDTLREIEIISARNQRQITKDTTVIQTLAGNASIRQGNTIMSGDSIVFNQRTGVAEVFGNVHINDADSVHTYSQYLRYIGNERIAFLKRGVKLTDGKATLTTEDLEYNLATGIASYKKGGKVINGKTVLTSTDATYYSDTKDVFFRKNVHLVDPKYDMRSDSLRYNTEFKEAYFISQTHIISKEGIIDTRSGTYNLETGKAVFDNGASFKDSIRFISGNMIAFEEKTGIIQIEGRGKFVDSTNNVTILGDQLLIDKKSNSFLATRKPVMILYRGDDSTYISADTLFSGLRKYDADEKNLNDSLKSTAALTMPANFDSTLRDTSVALRPKFSSPVIANPSGDTISNLNTERLSAADSAEHEKYKASLKDTTGIRPDTLKNVKLIDVNKVPKDSIRYFLGFHHVRIFNDSLQAVSDSMYYSTEDSTFKLFGSPVFWNDRTQVKGDTMHVYTENQKAKRLYVFFNAIVVNKTREGMHNQLGGRTINGYFKDGGIDYIRVKGSPAESVFYPQDDDSAYVGMNRSKGDVIDAYFLNKELRKIKFINNVDGTLFPLKQIPPDQQFLKNFIWEEQRRPKNKLELFE